MKNEQILKKATKKAVGNGYKLCQRSFDCLANLERGINLEYFLKENLYYPFIFSHSFAKAFWGEDRVCLDCGGFITDRLCNNYCITSGYHPRVGYRWQYHLSKIVLEDNKFKYLEKFL